jgi:hypothetical protein
MASVQELRNGIKQSYDIYVAELKLAGPVWEKKPGTGEGEEAWSARQVAEHITGTARFFAVALIRTLGGTAERSAPPEHPSLDNALGGTEQSFAELDAVVAGISDDQLALETKFGERSVESVLGIVIEHYKDHAGQLKTLRGS